ncbi:wax ester/triacylglycerol synthase domain-containing protein [Streptomyces microflavus]
MGTELLAPLDLAFWHLESDAHPMHLGALAVFAPASGVTRLHVLELLRTRAAAIPRLRMCVRDVLLPVGGAAWTVDKDFDVHRHVHRVAVADGDFMAGATRLAGELMEQPLGRGLPPWQMYLIGGADDGPFAVLVKLHHALADGMRAVAIGAGIFGEIAATAARPGARGRPAVPPRSWLPDPARWRAWRSAGSARSAGRWAWAPPSSARAAWTCAATPPSPHPPAAPGAWPPRTWTPRPSSGSGGPRAVPPTTSCSLWSPGPCAAGWRSAVRRSPAPTRAPWSPSHAAGPAAR